MRVEVLGWHRPEPEEMIAISEEAKGVLLRGATKRKHRWSLSFLNLDPSSRSLWIESGSKGTKRQGVKGAVRRLLLRCSELRIWRRRPKVEDDLMMHERRKRKKEKIKEWLVLPSTSYIYLFNYHIIYFIGDGFFGLGRQGQRRRQVELELVGSVPAWLAASRE